MNTGTNYAEIFYSGIDHDIHTLEKNVTNYPASSIAQFLLLYHQKKNNHSDLESLAKRTGIYFNNPLWIEYQLSQVVSGNKNLLSEVTEDETEIEEPSLMSENEVSDFQEISSSDEMNTEDEVFNDNSEEKAGTLIEPEQQPDENVNNPENEKREVENEEIIEEDEVTIETANQNVGLEDANLTTATEPVVESAEEETESVSFEPLHTVDYFASQGIKISEEALGNDELSKQVKSFTGWLKSMKKLHPDQTPQQNDVIEKIIQSSAEASNAEANVLTEAMAEVLIKQNKKEKAVEMYQKLSLINPSKSAYFAAKIESLKTL